MALVCWQNLDRPFPIVVLDATWNYNIRNPDDCGVVWQRHPIRPVNGLWSWGEGLQGWLVAQAWRESRDGDGGVRCDDGGVLESPLFQDWVVME